MILTFKNQIGLLLNYPNVKDLLCLVRLREPHQRGFLIDDLLPEESNLDSKPFIYYLKKNFAAFLHGSTSSNPFFLFARDAFMGGYGSDLFLFFFTLSFLLSNNNNRAIFYEPLNVSAQKMP